VTVKTAQAPAVEQSTAFFEMHGSEKQGRGLALAINLQPAASSRQS